jgi:hypothetical protein
VFIMTGDAMRARTAKADDADLMLAFPAMRVLQFTESENAREFESHSLRPATNHSSVNGFQRRGHFTLELRGAS